MAFWSGETLALRLESLVVPFDRSKIDCAAYTLSVGSEVYVSPDRKVDDPSRHTKRRLLPDEGFAVPPGQFAFLMSSETVRVPSDAIAFISIKAKLKFGGLINISGFHVDPGYKGKLLFSVLNAGPKSLHLSRGQPLFLLWYADLDRSTKQRKSGEGFEGIDSSVLNGISGEILSLQSLSDEITQQKIEVAKASQLRKWVIGIVTIIFIKFVIVDFRDGITNWISSFKMIVE